MKPRIVVANYEVRFEKERYNVYRIVQGRRERLGSYKRHMMAWRKYRAAEARDPTIAVAE